MSDRDWREAERAWQADPHDPARYEAALAARRRAGVPISGPLLAGVVHPPREFRSRESLVVYVLTVARDLVSVGKTPPMALLPEHRTWWIEGSPRAMQRARLAEPVPGITVRGEQRLDLAGLEMVRWRDLSHPRALAELPESLTRLGLWDCFARRPDWSHSLAPLPHLTELYLQATPLEPLTLTGLARLPNLLRLHVPNPTRHLRGQVHEALPRCRLASA